MTADDRTNARKRTIETTRRGERKRKDPRKATPKSLESAALHHLGRFASSAANLRQVLMRRVERSARAHATDRAAGAAAVDEIVARFSNSGLLDDRAKPMPRRAPARSTAAAPRPARSAAR